MQKKQPRIITRKDVVVRFAGDSGDGMQFTGTQFSDTSALDGNDVSTFPDYPAEIRAPQGTIGGVSGFQLHFGQSVNTPGDEADVLIAMNPAALRANLKWVSQGGTIVYDSDNFTDKNIQRAGYLNDPFKEEATSGFNLIPAPITMLTQTAVKDLGLDHKSVLRCKNMFALGLVYWLFHKSPQFTIQYIDAKFGKVPEIAEANRRALWAGYNYAENIEALPSYRVEPARIEKGTYRNINGNTAVAWGVLAAAEKAGLQLFLGSYPITPATGILEEIAQRKDMGAKSFQAEDEIAAVCACIGAAFGGAFAVTSTSGPGLALKTEAIGLAVMTELPLLIVDVQRGGPSTGLPTKTEQADLMQALFGRNGESPLPVIAASTPSNCFNYAYQASKIALEHMTPVILLTDGFLANSSQPWKIPDMNDLSPIVPPLAKEGEPYVPYKRDSETLVRTWATPGMPGCEHRLGGLEKMNETGHVSYSPENHEVMCKLRAEKIARIARFIPPLQARGCQHGELLMIGWGGTFGHLVTALQELEEEGYPVGLAHLTYIRPLPENTADVLSQFRRHLVFELNLGQMASYLRMNLPQFNYLQYNKIQGLPFTVKEIKEAVLAELNN